MKTTLTHSNLRRDSLLALLSFFLLNIGICQAQSSSGISIAIPLPITLAFFACACFCICFCIQLAKQRQRQDYGAPTNVQYAPYVYNPLQTQQAYSGQGYAPPSTMTVPSGLPLAPPGPEATQSHTAISLAAQATSEPVSLPEATLHQGDAPPAYEEAVGMKTDELQT